jgi:hypothetical protein
VVYLFIIMTNPLLWEGLEEPKSVIENEEGAWRIPINQSGS